LVFVGPAIYIIRLNVDLEGPVGLIDIVTVLIELGDLHEGKETNVVGDRGDVLSDSVTSTLVEGLTWAGRPSVLEEVERVLTVEVEHSKPVCACHAVTQKLDTVTRCSLADEGVRHGSIRNAHDDVLGTLERSSVRRVGVSNELHLGHETDGVRNLLSAFGHGVTAGIEADVHIGLEERAEFTAGEEPLLSAIRESSLPNDVLLADSGKGLVLGCVQMLDVPDFWAICNRVQTTVEFRLVLAPIIGPSNMFVSLVDSTISVGLHERLRSRSLSARFPDLATLSGGLIAVMLANLRHCAPVSVKELHTFSVQVG